MEKQRTSPERDALDHIVACRDKPFLEERYIDSFKGRGVFTHKAIEPSTFVVEYRGNIFSHKDPSPKKKYGDTLNKYLFGFSWKGEHWCVDASMEDGTLGRLVNDDHLSPNCKMKKIVFEGKPHLCLFAVREISPGEEITYNYGDSSYPWRSRLEDSAAASGFEISCFDDDDDDDCELPESGPSHDDINSQLDFRDLDSPLTDLDSSQKMCQDEAAVSSDEHGWDEDDGPSEARGKTKDPSVTSRNYCYVCGAGHTKISRHLFRHIDEEPDIAEAFALPKNSKERKRLLYNLRNRGNYRHNQEVLRNNSGELKLRRRPANEVVFAKTHVHCLYCKGMFKRKEMWRHVARCPSRTMSNPAAGGKTRVLSEIALAESPFCQKLPSGVWKMLLNMKQDEIAYAVQNDFLLLKLAQYLSENYANDPTKHDYIRQRLRELGRLLLALHEKSIFSFEDAIKPAKFYKVVEAVKEIAGFDEKMQSYNKPSLALNLGHSLKKIGGILLTGISGNEQMTRDAKTFMKLCAKEWSKLVSQTAVASLSGRKVNKPSTIPFTRDVQVFYRYLEATSASAIEGLQMSEIPQAYTALCRVTLAQASVLNKSAPEVSKMTLKTFQERGDATRVLSKHFIRINIVSRTGQNVAVLLTSDLVSAITLLVSKREACGVHQENPFLFAKPDSSSTSHYQGGNCIRGFLSLCHAKNPEHLRSVHLHKHIARVFQILNLENDELCHLAKLLGHDIRADRDYYRLPEAAVDLAKIAKLLLAMEKGSLESFKGNSLEEIEIEDELEPEVEQDNPETGDAEEDKESELQQSDAVEETQRKQLSPVQDALEHIKACRDKPFLEGMFIDPFKGRGVFTHKSIRPSTFVVEYQGTISPHKETRRTKCGDALNHYFFDFSWNGTTWRIDASKEDGSLGRLVNDDHLSPNCKMKKIVFEGKPHLCLFAVREISPGEEITYNYGDSSCPWRSAVEDSEGSSSSAVSEYVPEEEPSSEDSSASNNNQQRQRNHSDSSKQDSSCVPLEDEADHSSDDFTSDAEPQDTSRSRNYCYVCGRAQSKISRHLFTHRREEAEIAAVFALPLHSKERSRLLDELRNRGNYKHNQKVLKTHCGELKVRRRKPNMSITAKSFALCLYCKVMYRRKEMWRHMQKCSSNKSPKLPSCVKSKVLTLVDAAESIDPQENSSAVRKVLRSLKNDEIGSVVCNDSHILQLAQCLCRMKKGKPKRQDTITQRLRLMGRLLLTLRKKSVCSFEEAVKPKNFSRVVEAVRELSGFSEEMKSCPSPSLMTKLGNSLKKIGDINYARALKEEADRQTINEAETFMKLCAKEWSSVPTSISGVNKPPTVEFTQDVQLLHQCMEKTAASAVESLTMYESSPVYNALLRVTIAQVSVLNKNVVEVSKVTLKSFIERDEAELHEGAAVCQSQFEQTLSKDTVRINVMSKTGKKLAVTLTPKMLTAITLLVSKREACGVHTNNPFLFARPVAICTSFCHGQQCVSTFVDRCGAKNTTSLRSEFFRKHIARVFQILSLTNDELEQLATRLGRDIRTDREYYRKPEAAVDVAKILKLLSAMEDGSLERFEGKSLEEIEVEDELEPDVQQGNPENSDAEEDNGESESLLRLSNLEEDKPTTSKEGLFWAGKKAGRVSSARKRGRSSRQESENGENDDEGNTEKDDGSEETPASCAADTPEQTLSRSNEDATNICFSDNDEDMDVDFDFHGDGGTTGSAAVPSMADGKDVTKQDNDGSDTEEEDDSVDIESVKHVEKGDSRRSSPILNTEKKKRVSAALAGMKELKILIPKLDIEKLHHPVHISGCQHREDSDQRPTPAAAADLKHEPSHANAVQMICSHCSKSMMKGQTAYQKKGFTDVFCSKNCLFQMCPVNKPVTETCHYCLKAISQPLDLIMAAVDIKGTMKDFCSTTCLCSFRSNTVSTAAQQSVCSMCNKTCTTTCELTLNEAVHKFCSDSCLEDFRRDNMADCESCGSLCRDRPLILKLEDETKTICSQGCLDQFRETNEAPHQCTMCHTSLPMSHMVDDKSGENVVELFCTRTCVTSHRLRPATVYRLQGKKSPSQLKKRKRGRLSKQTSNTDDVSITSDSAVNESDASAAAESDATPTFIIADSCVVCCHCGKKLPRGQTHYQPRNSPEVFCSAACLSERHPNIKVVTKRCYNCFQVILRPHNIILAPVDDSGTMKELCSNSCLSSVNSKRSTAAPKPPPLAGPRSECRICAKFCFCKFRRTVDGAMHRICSDACFVSYHKTNNLPVFTCDACSSFCHDERLVLKTEDGSKTVCGEGCLVKFKERVETPQLCPMCRTSHQMSDMVESKTEEGRLDFFCSSRCMMVHKAQSFTVPGRNSPSFDENDIKEVKPLLPNLDFIKKEPIDDEYNQNLTSSMCTQDIKDEPNVVKEDLKIDSVFSLKGGSTSAAPIFTHMDLPASCSNCKTVLKDRETVYQRKGHREIFCSSSCLLTFYQMKEVKKTCNFCLQPIMQSQDVLKAPVDAEGTEKDFCSQTCLSSFNYKRTTSTKVTIAPAALQSQCNMCSRYCISKHEIIRQDVVHKICSDPCFLRFCNMNNPTICENCRSSCSTPLTLKMDDGCKKLCSADCLARFKQKIKTPQPCAMCCTSHLMSDMVESRESEDVVELFCTSSCVMASKIQAVSAAGTPLNCDNCGKSGVPACHLAMSDASIRNFCTLSCAIAFKGTQKEANAATNPGSGSDPPQCDFLKPPEKLPCAQCRRILKTTPKVIQKKGKMNFVCSLACCQEFKRINNIMGKCEYCKNERIIRDAKRIDGKDCYFCSDGCKMLFRHELKKKWGEEHCRSCAFCLSISRTVVTARYDGADEEFCSEACNSNYNMLFCHLSKCDTCGREGKLRQSLPMLGEVKHFCDLRCVLHFCNKKVQMANTVCSPPGSASTVESSPVIANVVSLAGVLARQPSASASSAQHVSVRDIQTKVVGHAGIQTVPKELKNKSILCTPLVHNKGVSCTTQTADSEAQTDNFAPRVLVLPVPVPVYLPVPMNMYSQYTPKPVGLPLPLPVPVFLPVTPGGPDPTVKSTKKKMMQVTKEEERREAPAPTEHTGNCSDDLDADHQDREESLSDTSFGAIAPPHTHEKPPPVLHVSMLSEPQPEPPPAAPPPALEVREDPAPTPPLLQARKVPHKNKGRKLQQLSRAAKAQTSQRDTSNAARKRRKLRSRCGTDAWRRWTRWRDSQTELDLVSSDAVTFSEDVLRCSATELNDGLCCFIAEVTRPTGETYPPDSLFYLCLSIQQYLFENGRMENIFSDPIYKTFCRKFTDILRAFKPSAAASGYVRSRVEEEFLWDCKQLGAYSPIVLLNTLLFFCCKNFGFTTVEQHRQLSFAHVMRCTKTNQNNTKTTFLRFYPPLSINEAETDADGVPAKKRKRSECILEMMENSENPLRCPVRLYEFYLSKCSESVRQRADLFYLRPDRCCVPSSPLWFSSTPLDDATMEAMLVRILAVRELQEGDRGGENQPTPRDTFVPDGEEDSEG